MMQTQSPSVSNALTDDTHAGPVYKCEMAHATQVPLSLEPYNLMIVVTDKNTFYNTRTKGILLRAQEGGISKAFYTMVV